ncbi:MAG: 3-methyl-2-oxobutanoate hydroxymethyltransferase, partial [Thermus caldifontis]
FHDVVGLYGEFKPRFVKRYLEGGRLFHEALSRFVREVREGVFPDEEHSF